MQHKHILSLALLAPLLATAGCTAKTATNSTITNESSNEVAAATTNLVETNGNLNSVTNEANSTNTVSEKTTKKELLSAEELAWLEGLEINVDGASFEILSNDLAKDVSAVYYKKYVKDENDDLQPYIDSINQADPATITIVQETHPLLVKDKTRLFIRHYQQGFIPVDEIDITTFQLTDDETTLGEDDQHYLYESGEVNGYLVVDKDVFTILDSTFAKDNEHVYIAAVYDNSYDILDRADPNTFRVLEYGYALDKRTVYAPHILYEGRVMNELAEADQATFRVLATRMAIDEQNIYNNGNRFDQFQVDIPTFTDAGVAEFFYDKNYAYIFRANSGFKLKDIDRASFAAISGYGGAEGMWWKDKNGVYIGILGEINEFAGEYTLDYGKLDVDPATFSDLVVQDCAKVAYAEGCQDFDRFYSYKDSDGSYGFSSSMIISRAEGFIPHQTLTREE